MYRGSRKHVLDWTASHSFPAELEELLAPVPVSLSADAAFMPRGYREPQEARLESFGPRVFGDGPAWPDLRCWWLAHKAGANTPNWDIAAGCDLEGRPGPVLVEAKANWPELGLAGKPLDANASARSVENHERIGLAIAEACRGWQELEPDVCISRDDHYQLANRLAFAWKLASLGVPVVLVYLGFTGDSGIADAGRPFRDDADWQAAFGEYATEAGALGLFNRRHEIVGTPAWLLSRCRPVIEISSPRRAASVVVRPGRSIGFQRPLGGTRRCSASA